MLHLYRNMHISPLVYDTHRDAKMSSVTICPEGEHVLALCEQPIDFHFFNLEAITWKQQGECSTKPEIVHG
jgi:hypothetical protein